MAIKVVNALKYLGLFSIVFFTVTSCEKEIESIGVNLVNNNNFTTNKDTSEVTTANKNIVNVPSNGLAQYLLGVYSDNEFGTLKASIVSQLNIPVTGDAYNYGTNYGIDSVLMFIPYQATKLAEKYADGKPKFSIDSVFGNPEVEFQLGIYELKTFLNTLDPIDPSKPAVYYSDKEFQKGDEAFYSGNFKVNPDDTVAYIKRYMPNGTSYAIDTVKATDKSPSIKIPLNENLIKGFFVDNAAGAEFQTLDAFQRYFRGFYIEATTLTSNKAHLVSLAMSNAKMVIYYSKDENEGAAVDLNGNKINGEQGVRTKHSFEFAFGSIKSNVLIRDLAPHQSGEDRLYVQGAAGSMATIELFKNENIVDLQKNNWLINDASLIFYVDQNAASNIAPEQLFIFNYDDKEQLTDMMTEGLAAVGGLLERDAAGKPYRYVFKITDYISKLLSANAPTDLEKKTIGLKVFNPSDVPANILDTKIKDFSWTPKGVVLFGQDLSFGDKRVKLEISYTKLNN